MRRLKKYSTIVCLLFSLLLVIGCHYRPFGKNSTRFTIENCSDKFIDWRICPKGGTSASAIKMFYLDDNQFICKEKLAPGTYTIAMRKKGQGFSNVEVNITDDKWDYIIPRPGTQQIEEQSNSNLTARFMDSQLNGRKVGVLFWGDDLVLSEATIKNNTIELPLPSNIGSFQILIITKGFGHKSWTNRSTYSGKESISIGPIELN